MLDTWFVLCVLRQSCEWLRWTGAGQVLGYKDQVLSQGHTQVMITHTCVRGGSIRGRRYYWYRGSGRHSDWLLEDEMVPEGRAPEASVSICQDPSPRRGQSCKGPSRAAMKPTGRTSLSPEKRLSAPFPGIVPPAGTGASSLGARCWGAGTREAGEIHSPLLQAECCTSAAFKPNFLKVSEGKKCPFAIGIKST